MGIALTSIMINETETSNVHPFERSLGAARKAKKGDAARDTLRALIQSDSATLSKLPHPTPYLANQGATLLDYANWVLEHSNSGGIVIALSRVQSMKGGTQ